MSGEIIIVGTAHVSAKSVAEVNEVIERERPDVVAVELCRKRLESIKKKVPDELSAKDLLKGNIYVLLVQWLLAFLQRRIGSSFGIDPGAEMLSAVEAAERMGVPIALVDRNIGITMNRLWMGMGIIEKFKILFTVFSSIFQVSKIEEELDLEKITQDDVVFDLIEEMRKLSPSIARFLVDERDAYMSYQLLKLRDAGRKVVVVVGAGHKPGITRYLNHPEALPLIAPLLAVKKRRVGLGKTFGIVIVAIFALTFISALSLGIPLRVLGMAFLVWILINGILSAVGTFIARGHPLSILTAFSVAWLTSLNPFIAAGWITGLVEFWVRKPGPKDFKEILEVDTLSTLLNNKLFRVILVAVGANIGSMIGTFLGIYVVLQVTGINPTEVIAMAWEKIVGFIL